MTLRTLYLLGSGLLATVLALGACNGLRNQCFDGEDNDKDGLVDAADPGCSYSAQRMQQRAANCAAGANTGLPVQSPACQSTTGMQGSQESDDPPCFDKKDNDGDNLADFPDDPGCDSITDEDESNPECSDGIDNDNDGLLDYHQERGCIDSLGNPDPRAKSEHNDPACSNGRDDDNDGKIDYPADLGCINANDASERNPECSDGRDNDGDGAVDFPADNGCNSTLSDREAARACGDGIDNDRDGLVDYPDDPGCPSLLWDDETNPACSDGRDNDGDGYVDFAGSLPDASCVGPLDTSEAEPPCSDGRDNDGDGLVDFPEDPTCQSPEDAELEPQCRNGRDDDGDGRADYPSDAGCDAVDDNSEGQDPACSDGIDNDGDGLADFPADTSCVTWGSASEQDADGDCNDGIDNDGDGFIDNTIANRNQGDPACVNGYAYEALDPACGDGLDNDGDGRADFAGVDRNYDGAFNGPGDFEPDPGCNSATHYSENVKPQCADGVDNDGDGTADHAGLDVNHDGLFTGAGELRPDIACASDMRGRDELRPQQCRDGVDNDGDGFVDFEPLFLPGASPTPNPNAGTGDAQCANAFDNSEGL